MQCRGQVMIMVVWVDDISTAYHKDCTAEYEAFWSKFRAKFQLRPVQDYLGMEVLQNIEEKTLSFNCSDNINRILKQFEQTSFKKASYTNFFFIHFQNQTTFKKAT
jgi:hypothetical protein